MPIGPGKHIVLSHHAASKLLDAAQERDRTEISPDLGRSTVEVALSEDGVNFPNGVTVDWDDVAMIANEESKCFVVDAAGPRAIQVFSQTTNWMRTLMPTRTIPTTLVSGLTMHRIKGSDPRASTKSMIRAVRPRGRVLDTALGLGYTAIEAAKRADEVVTVEIDPAAIEIAEQNPWSRELFEMENIEIVLGDIAGVIATFESDAFDHIIHDPPAMRLAGDLYAQTFYQQLLRVLKPRGWLYHYVGDPKSKAGKSVTSGVIRRLQAAGFRRVERRPQAYGVVARG